MEIALSNTALTSMLLSINNDISIHVPNSTKYMTTYILLEQEDWFETEMNFIRNYIKPDMNIIDIGSNHGVYTLNFAKCINNQGNIFSFEPTPKTHRLLQESIKYNGFSTIKLYREALSHKVGEATFYSSENSELNSLGKIATASEQISVKTNTLDNLSHLFNRIKIDFIKIDAEGEETNILEGATHFLKHHNPLIMFEYKHGDTINTALLDAFEKLGYVITRHIPGLNILFSIQEDEQWDTYQLNLFCCKQEKLDQLVASNIAADKHLNKIEIPDELEEFWVETLRPRFFPNLFNHMIHSLSSEKDDIALYISALNNYCISVNYDLNSNDRIALLRYAFNILKKLIQETNRLEYLLTYSRVSLDLGYREICVNTLSTILKNFNDYKNTDYLIPFIPTLNKNLAELKQQPVMDQIYLRTFENIEKLSNLSSYFVAGRDYKNLETLVKLGSKDAHILRRHQLVKMRQENRNSFECIPELSIRSLANLNPHIWSNHCTKIGYQKKAESTDIEGRFREIMKDPNNSYIPKVKNAGQIIDDYVVMHNGLKVKLGENSYYGDFSKILLMNKGVHEPQEERVFMEVLKHIPKNSTMVELGAYWAFYSMWFQKLISGATNYMIEPDNINLNSGKNNFILNNMQGDFTLGNVGNHGIKIDEFVKVKNIHQIDILHSDIQGYELEMLQGAQKTISQGKIKLVFVSTHSQKLHYDCLDFLKLNNYNIIASVDFDNETYCYDGIIVAKLGDAPGPDKMLLPVRISRETLSINKY